LIEATTDERFHRMIDVNLLGPMLCAQAVIPTIRRHRTEPRAARRGDPRERWPGHAALKDHARRPRPPLSSRGHTRLITRPGSDHAPPRHP
jgi:NAD(P)-dependent dehydrogenase (short-subunit alcohol dehydrogenase family)